MVTGLEPQQVTDPLKIIIFNKHLFNREIKKSIAKGYNRNLKEAFDRALASERKAKKFEGLTDDDPSVMAITARRQVNQVTATTQREQTPVMADLNQIVADGMQPILHLIDKSSTITAIGMEKEDTMQESAHSL